MQFEPLTQADLEEIRILQPDGWSDIVPDFEYYIRSSFCYPIKAFMEDKIVGVATTIEFKHTAWLAHIIVDSNFRERGIGYGMVQELLKSLKNRSIETCLLIATELGKPVYTKAGFRTVTEYVFLNREKPWQEMPISGQVVNFQEEYRSRIYELDWQITGECREILLSEYLDGARLYLKDRVVMGCYIPGLREGLIVADTAEAGLELMKLKFAGAEKAALPSDNKVGLEFLKQHGFIETEKKGTRMILGNEISWQPEKIFSRIGGNFG